MANSRSGALHNGFSLIEVLVSILVLSLGVIGAAGMQLSALRTSRQAAIQTTALELAVEMADMLRANDSLIASGGLAVAGKKSSVWFDYSTSAEPEAPGMFCYGKRANCDSAQMADFEIYEWKKRLKSALPRARAVICRDSAPWSPGLRSYKWECDASSTGTDEAPVGMAAPLAIKIGWPGKNPDGSPVRDERERFLPELVLIVEPHAG